VWRIGTNERWGFVRFFRDPLSDLKGDEGGLRGELLRTWGGKKKKRKKENMAEQQAKINRLRTLTLGIIEEAIGNVKHIHDTILLSNKPCVFYLSFFFFFFFVADDVFYSNRLTFQNLDSEPLKNKVSVIHRIREELQPIMLVAQNPLDLRPIKHFDGEDAAVRSFKEGVRVEISYIVVKLVELEKTMGRNLPLEELLPWALIGRNVKKVLVNLLLLNSSISDNNKQITTNLKLFFVFYLYLIFLSHRFFKTRKFSFMKKMKTMN
jgi:hypothetical protein